MAETDEGAGPDQVGETGGAVINGQVLAGENEDGERRPDLEADPDMGPIHGGDVSETPAAQGGTRGAGTGADLGTGGEVGITQPGGATT